jgi:hypothetical protein
MHTVQLKSNLCYMLKTLFLPTRKIDKLLIDLHLVFYPNPIQHFVSVKQFLLTIIYFVCLLQEKINSL